ncbi:hypothetical protein ACFCYP_36590, partial [Streptomyces hydrogenans]
AAFQGAFDDVQPLPVGAVQFGVVAEDEFADGPVDVPQVPHPVAERELVPVRDTYAVDVVREDADAALLIAVAVCVIRMAERED